MSKFDVDPHKGPIAWFANNSVAANLLMMLIIVSGLFMLGQVQKQMFPEIEFNMISVQVPYLGAAPQEVEQGVLIRIEDAIKDVDGIKRISSTAREGMGSVSIEVEGGYDVQVVMDEVKMLIDAIPSFPQQIEKPNIYQLRPQREVIWIGIYGDMGEAMQKELAKQIRDELKRIGGISKVEVVGARNYEISVEISEADLQRYNLTFQDIVAAIRGTSIDVAGGSIKTPNGDILLRANNQAYAGGEFEEIVLIKRPDGTRLTLSDIAVVKDEFVEQRRFTRFNGKNATFVRVDSVGDQNDLLIAEVVKRYVEDKAKDLPPEVTIEHWGDSSYYLKDRLNLMTSNMISGGLLVFLCLALFMQIRLAFWVMIGIPVCFLGTIALMPLPMFDISLNMISLFGFILVLAIVVDDAIIIGESVYSEIEEKGRTVDNVVIGAKKVAMPATFGVLTTMIAFTPMLMIEGVMGKIWESIAWVLILCLGFSLVESKLILPAHLANMKYTPRSESKLNRFQKVRNKIADGLMHIARTYYHPFLLKCVRFRYATVATFIAMFILSIGLIASGTVRWVFFPDIPSDFIRASVQMQPGSAEEATIRTLNVLEQKLLEVDARAEQEIGENIIKHTTVFLTSATTGTIIAELEKGESRSLDGFAILNEWREKVPEIAGVKALNFQGSIVGGSSFDVEFQLTGRNLEELSAAATLLRHELASFEGVFDIEDTFGEGNDEVVLELKPLATAMGITLQDLATQVRFAFYGAEAQRVQRDDEEVKVMVRYPLSERQSVGNLESMKLRTADGSLIPFTELADIRFAKGYNTISRINGERSVNVRARVDKSSVQPFDIVRQVRDEKIQPILDRYPSVGFKLEGASQDEAEATSSLAVGFAIAMFGIYAVMAVPLRSYIQPVILMSVIPFGLIGAVIGHLLLGMPVSLLSLFGVLALSGVIVNDSLVMVNYVNWARSQGEGLFKAVTDAGVMRFRAIILTSLTTFLGLAPIMMERSMQAKMVIPMAVSLAFGILFATVITLFLVPCFYMILDDFKQGSRKVLSWYGLAKPPTPESEEQKVVT
ncbi:Multidrug efflux pump subunit AcrB [Pseudidiomarina indica]|uniref:Multidrug efflux pump subunit AcrB n=1 Tax=Pseudidiomarina indica TaxID=1159017 RepID=A0A1G6AWS5_9GAMM|nr:efflux RND transporter permease subunit [Pseudidiomarina indica]SDB12764.1 Multidrug efflux pump subunit AcrB [Pseudidiomarina indica]